MSAAPCPNGHFPPSLVSGCIKRTFLLIRCRKTKKVYLSIQSKKSIQLLMASIQENQINYILSLAQTGSFSQAAEQCFVTQSTLSTMIKKYENQIGFKIFNRKTKPISLTAEGYAIIEQLKTIKREFENLNEIVREAKGELNGEFKIGIIPTIAPFLLPRFLNKITSDYPNIEFRIFEITTEEIINKIKLRDLDAGIVSTPLSDSDLLEYPLFQEDFLVYDTRKGKKGKKYTVGDIDFDRLWLLEEGHCMRNQIEKICSLRKQRTVKGNLVYSSGSVLSLIELVKSSKGITLLPRLAIENNSLVDRRFIYPLVQPVPTREIGLVTHSNFAKKRFLNILQTSIINSLGDTIQLPKDFKMIRPF